MINLKKIKQLAILKEMPLSEIAKRVGITEQGLFNLMSKNTCNLSTLQKIAEALDVSEAVFFESSTDGCNNISVNTGVSHSPNAIQSINSDGLVENAVLKERIKGLELLNQAYKEQIEMLKSQITK